MRKLHLCAFAFVLCLLSSFAIGQSYPARPVRMIVPFPPGESVDIIGRLIGQKLSDMLGTQFVIDNRPGAGSVVGISIAAGAPPDGYTLALVSVAFAINDTMHEKRQYDAKKDTVQGQNGGLLKIGTM